MRNITKQGQGLRVTSQERHLWPFALSAVHGFSRVVRDGMGDSFS